MIENSDRIAILGAGSWGLAVASLLARNGHDVCVWSYLQSEADELITTRTSPKLPQINLVSEIDVTTDLKHALSDSKCVVFALPTQTVRNVAMKLGSFIQPEMILVSLSKGIEKSTLRRVSEVLIDEIPAATENNVAVISGPSHAEEVALCKPTSVVVASSSERVGAWVQEVFSSGDFRVYRSDDVVGVEMGGAVKNIIAIAAGIAVALKLGDNALGALLTRGLAEMSRLGLKLGANPLTFAGLSGIGDLITTCFSKHSRNRAVGEKIGLGKKLPEILESIGMVAEGVDTCVSVRDLARQKDVETPITDAVYSTLFENKDPRAAVRELMGRSLKEEMWS
ncbi:MAG: NAD(P)-dependent glycerol-3-phosphate dehydrogenase [candidate division Zixibacteria bacterium]|nr:NAD(P)-dependent glycerol-3-phosphate dehydrogenase [candidate division Zixibacteria bacterium]